MMTTPSAPSKTPISTNRSIVSDSTRDACRVSLQEFRDSLPGIRSVGLVGPDGFEVASVGAKTIAVSKVAALTSTMVAVGQAFSQEVGLPACRDLILDTEAGCSVFMAVAAPKGVFSFYAVAEDGTLVGRVLSRARICVQGLKHLISSDAGTAEGATQ